MSSAIECAEQSDHDAETVARRLRRRALRLKRQQLTAGIAKLDEHQRVAVESLCDRLAFGLLARPLAALDLAAENDDRELTREVATLFGVDGEPASLDRDRK
ncbi:MAG: hypothetical protein ACOCY6_05950 [Halodesulfurarchaeum sp.]